MARLLFALFASSCAASDRTSTFAVRDSAGVEIIESTRAAWGDDPEWHVADTTRLVIGGVEGDVHYQFYQIVDALRLPDGRIVVADGGSNTIRFFTAEGDFLLQVGGPGAGPGEFQRLTSLSHLPGDSLVAFDSGLKRVTLFAGTSVASVTNLFPPNSQTLSDLARLSDGRYVARMGGAWSGGSNATLPGLYRPAVLVMLFSSTGSQLSTIGDFPGPEWALTEIAGRVVPGMAPFGRTLIVALLGEQVLVGTADALGFDVYDLAGQHVRSVRVLGHDLSIAPEDMHRLVQSYVAQAPADEQARKLVAEYFAAVPVPDRKAAYSRALVDEEQHVWLGEYEAGNFATGRWHVFNPAGTYLGHVQFAPEFSPFEVGEQYVLGRWRNELGVESIRLYGLQRR